MFVLNKKSSFVDYSVHKIFPNIRIRAEILNKDLEILFISKTIVY